MNASKHISASQPRSDAPPAWDLVDRFYAGEATPEESAVMQRYLASHPERAQLFTQLLGKLGPPPGAARAPVDAMLAAAHARMSSAHTIKRIVRTL